MRLTRASLQRRQLLFLALGGAASACASRGAQHFQPSSADALADALEGARTSGRSLVVLLADERPHCELPRGLVLADLLRDGDERTLAALGQAELCGARHSELAAAVPEAVRQVDAWLVVVRPQGEGWVLSGVGNDAWTEAERMDLLSAGLRHALGVPHESELAELARAARTRFLETDPPGLQWVEVEQEEPEPCPPCGLAFVPDLSRPFLEHYTRARRGS